MNQQMQDQEMKNPWSDQGSIPRVATRHILLAAVACFVCAQSLPLCANEWIALGVLAFLFAYVAIAVVSRQPRNILPTSRMVGTYNPN
jgi:hypothetical protein